MMCYLISNATHVEFIAMFYTEGDYRETFEQVVFINIKSNHATPTGNVLLWFARFSTKMRYHNLLNTIFYRK